MGTGRWGVAAGVVAVIAVAGACSSGAGSDAGGGTVEGPGSADATITVVSQNLLHGTACPADSDRCDLPARAALFVDQLADAGCPAIVSMQEANPRTAQEVTDALGAGCTADYVVVGDEDPTNDREVVLTTAPVLGSRRIHLAGPLRTALWVRIAADVGIVDYVSTHLASGSDNRPCDEETCPPPCTADDTLNTCQGRQAVAFADEVATPDSVVVLGGDLNDEPDGPTIAAIEDAGFVDSHLEIGNDECDPDTGAQCTSGRIDDAMTDLEDPESQQVQRIDFLFHDDRRDCTAVDPTGLFNAEPASGDLAFPSDHTGVQLTLSCPTTTAQVEDATTATVPDVTTTTAAAGGDVDAATEAAVAQAFTNLFDGSVTDVDVKLGWLERADELRPYFLDSFEQTREVAAGIRVRIDSIEAIDDTHADVTYTLVLDGSPVLDHLPGTAVNIDGEWLVSLRTYCDVSTQGADEIPEPCQ